MVQSRHALLWLALAPILLIFLMEIYYKLPLAIGQLALRWPTLAGGYDEAIDGYAEKSIAATCSERWSSDTGMRAICSHHAEAGLADFARLWMTNARSPAGAATLKDCFLDHTERGVTDFALAGSCARIRTLSLRQTPMPPPERPTEMTRAWGMTLPAHRLKD